MKKIMILGAGSNQLPLIKAAKKIGCCVAVCDYSDKAVGVSLADEFYPVSIMDIDAVLEATKASGADGIISNSEPAMPVVAFVAIKLGLPTNDYETIAAMTDKSAFRSLLKNKGIFAPCFASAKSYDEARAAFDGLQKPVMVKPAASSGSRGVVKLENDALLKTAFENALSYSRSNSVILEEYIENSCGNVIGGDIFVSDGEIVFFGLMSSVREESNPLVPKGEVFPAILSEQQAASVKAELSRAIELLGFRFGAINIEAVINKAGEVCFIELNPRNGGNLIPDELFEATGFDIFNATVRAALGEKIQKHVSKLKIPCATYMVSSAKSGVLKGVSFSEQLKPFIDAYYPDAKPGDTVEPFVNADKRVGVLMLRFESVSQRDEILKNIEENIYVEVE